ncbi:hypothetical protein WDW86_13225 [Bdellovibrionota bacterium FG-2]
MTIRSLILLAVLFVFQGCSLQGGSKRVPQEASTEASVPLAEPSLLPTALVPEETGGVPEKQTEPQPDQQTSVPVIEKAMPQQLEPSENVALPSLSVPLVRPLASPTPRENPPSAAPAQKDNFGKSWVAWTNARGEIKQIDRPLKALGAIETVGEAAAAYSFTAPIVLPMRPANELAMVFDIPGKLKTNGELFMEFKGSTDNIPFHPLLIHFEKLPVQPQYKDGITRIALNVSHLERIIYNDQKQTIQLLLSFKDDPDGEEILSLQLDFQTTPLKLASRQYSAFAPESAPQILQGDASVHGGTTSLKLLKVIELTNHSQVALDFEVPVEISGVIERSFTSHVPWSDYTLCTSATEHESWVEKRERNFKLIPLKKQGGLYSASERPNAISPGETQRYGLYDEEAFTTEFIEDTLQAKYEANVDVLANCAPVDNSSYPMWSFKMKTEKSVLEAGPVLLKLNLPNKDLAYLFPNSESVLLTPAGTVDALPGANWKGLERAKRHLSRAHEILASPSGGANLGEALKNLSLAVTFAEGQDDEEGGVQYEALFNLARALIGKGQSFLNSELKTQMKFYWLAKLLAQKAQSLSPEQAESYYYEALATSKIAVRSKLEIQLPGYIQEIESLLGDASDRNTKDNLPGERLDGFGALRIKGLLQYTQGAIELYFWEARAVETTKKSLELDRSHAGNWYFYGMFLVERDSLRNVNSAQGCEVLNQLLGKNLGEMTSEWPFEAAIEQEAARQMIQQECLTLRSRS